MLKINTSFDEFLTNFSEMCEIRGFFSRFKTGCWTLFADACCFLFCAESFCFTFTFHLFRRFFSTRWRSRWD